MEIQKYRILEWASVFTSGERRVEYEIQAQSATDVEKWKTLGTLPTLEEARKALLLHVPDCRCGLTWAAMTEPSPEQQTIVSPRKAWQEAVDLALFISDEMQMGRLPNQNGVSALRMFADLMSLTKDLS
jgi:hypothetical protein